MVGLEHGAALDAATATGTVPSAPKRREAQKEWPPIGRQPRRARRKLEMSIHKARPIENVLPRLSNVKSVASDRWIVSCPNLSHGQGRGDRNPSLSVAEADDGTVLFNCFAGCTSESIVSAIGLTLADLFPPDNDHSTVSRVNHKSSRKLAQSFPTIDDLIAQTQRAILITNFWYIRTVDATDMTVTGMTRDGTFLVEDGRIVCGLRNFRFHDSPLRCLTKVDAATPPMESITMERGKMLLPAVQLPDFHLSSVTRF